jgi:hypothetical protein
MPIQFSQFRWPVECRYWLANARVPACLLPETGLTAVADDEGVVCVDLCIENGALVRIEPKRDAYSGDAVRLDLGGRQVWPT